MDNSPDGLAGWWNSQRGLGEVPAVRTERHPAKDLKTRAIVTVFQTLGNPAKGISEAFLHGVQESELGFWDILEMLFPVGGIGLFSLSSNSPLT